MQPSQLLSRSAVTESLLMSIEAMGWMRKPQNDVLKCFCSSYWSEM
jgi:hypothetical protein